MKIFLMAYGIKCICLDSMKALSYSSNIISDFRSDAGKSIKTFYEVTGLESQLTVYKEPRPQQILKSEEKFKTVIM